VLPPVIHDCDRLTAVVRKHYLTVTPGLWSVAASGQRYRAVKLLVASFGCETWSVALRTLREIFGTKREEVTGNWRKLHNEELYDWCFPTDIVRGPS